MKIQIKTSGVKSDLENIFLLILEQIKAKL